MDCEAVKDVLTPFHYRKDYKNPLDSLEWRLVKVFQYKPVCANNFLLHDLLHSAVQIFLYCISSEVKIAILHSQIIAAIGIILNGEWWNG